VKVFNANSLVVAASSDVDIDIQDATDFFEKTFKSAAVVDDDQAAEADFQKNVLDEETSEIVSSGIIRGGDEDKAGKVAHGIHKVRFATVVGDLARGPEIDVKNVEGAAKGPRKDKLAVAGDSSVRSDAVRALKHPVSNVFTAARPEEAEADSMQSFVDTHVASRGRSVVCGKDVTAQRQRNNDQHQHFLIVLHGLKYNELAIEERDAVLANVVSISGVESNDIRFGEGDGRREAIKQKVGVRILLVGGGPIERGWDRADA
jgi:hypothetical protein